MGRIADALKALAGKSAPDVTMASPTVTTPRGGTNQLNRTVTRDRAMQPTDAPPGARQIWELWRVRNESRDLELRSPIWGGYCLYARVQAIGHDFSRLHYRSPDPRTGRPPRPGA